MKNWSFRLFAIAAPLLLGGCLWGPGKFTSDLALRKNGTFTLDYRGEIMPQIPEDKIEAQEAWDDSKVACTDEGQPEKPHPCTRKELDEARAAYERDQAAAASKRDENEKMAKLFGLPGTDDESNRRFAANLTKYQGWRSARYVGKGVFEVDYHFEGRVGQDYVFPMMPDADFIIPFVTIRRRTDGSVMVTAPALTGGSGPFGARAKTLNLPDKGDGPPSRAEGRFTITTDGEILTNNSEDGPVAGPSGKSVRWDVSPGTNKIPEMLVRL